MRETTGEHWPLRECEQTRLLVTTSASWAPCSFATGLDNTRRRHQQRASYRIVPRPRVGQIWSGHVTVSARFVRSYTAQDRLGTRISGGLGVALWTVSALGVQVSYQVRHSLTSRATPRIPVQEI